MLRCAVARLRASSVCCRGAIGFDRHLPWFVDEDGYGVHGGETIGDLGADEKRPVAAVRVTDEVDPVGINIAE